jgi:hypothetical protein
MNPSFQEYADKLNQSMSSFKGKYTKKEEVKIQERPEDVPITADMIFQAAMTKDYAQITSLQLGHKRLTAIQD